MASENNFPRYKLIPLLFLSGFCALVYQVAWLRELRLVFGVSTMAISAVLAIFMGGIGIGSYIFHIIRIHIFALFVIKKAAGGYIDSLFYEN